MLFTLFVVTNLKMALMEEKYFKIQVLGYINGVAILAYKHMMAVLCLIRKIKAISIRRSETSKGLGHMSLLINRYGSYDNLKSLSACLNTE